MTAGQCLAAVGILLASTAVAGELWEDPQALDLAWGGNTSLDRIDLSPAATAHPGTRWVLSHTRWFADAGLRGHGMRWEQETRSGAVLVAVAQLSSPVHRQRVLRASGQWSLPRGVRAGVGVGVQQLTFASVGASHLDGELRLGLGIAVAQRTEAVGMLRLDAERPEEPAEVRAALQWRPLPDGAVVAEVEAPAGLPATWRLGASWSLGALGFRAGAEAATASLGAGLHLGAGRWTVQLGSLTHPDLGTSQGVAVAWGRRAGAAAEAPP